MVNTPGGGVVNILGNLDFPLANTLGFLIYLLQASELIYFKWLVPNTAGSHSSTVYSLQGSRDALE
jgi:hypothetical protein